MANWEPRSRRGSRGMCGNGRTCQQDLSFMLLALFPLDSELWQATTFGQIPTYPTSTKDNKDIPEKVSPNRRLHLPISGSKGGDLSNPVVWLASSCRLIRHLTTYRPLICVFPMEPKSSYLIVLQYEMPRGNKKKSHLMGNMS